jgi:hypothetical protein
LSEKIFGVEPPVAISASLEDDPGFPGGYEDVSDTVNM